MGSDVGSGLSDDVEKRLRQAIVAVFRKAPAALSADMPLGQIAGLGFDDGRVVFVRARGRVRRRARRDDVCGDQTIADVVSALRDRGATVRLKRERIQDVITRDRRTLETEIRTLIGDLVEASPASVELDRVDVCARRRFAPAHRAARTASGRGGHRLFRRRMDGHDHAGRDSRPCRGAAAARSPDARPGCRPARRSPGRRNPSTTRPGLAVERLEIGMPLTGRNNLGETPLLQYLGDQRWRHVSRVLDIPSRDIVDEDGERLYATFFYVEVGVPGKSTDGCVRRKRPVRRRQHPRPVWRVDARRRVVSRPEQQQ